jgi:hypothetical protein
MDIECNVMDFFGAQSHGIGIGWITWITREKCFILEGRDLLHIDLNVEMQLKLHPTHPT